LLAQVESLDRRIQQLQNPQVDEAQSLLAVARRCGMKGLQISGRSLPADGPDAQVLNLPNLPYVAIDPRIKGVSFTQMEANIKAHQQGKKIEIESGSFASNLSKMPVLETFTIEFDMLEDFLPRLQTTIDNARKWVFPRPSVKSEDSEREMEMRVLGDTKMEIWAPLNKTQRMHWENSMRPRPGDRAITMILTWRTVRKVNASSTTTTTTSE